MMPLTLEQALALKPGDKVKDNVSEYVVIDVKETGPEQVRVNMTREDWGPDNGTYFTEMQLAAMSFVAAAEKQPDADPAKPSTDGDPAKLDGEQQPEASDATKAKSRK